MVEAETDFQWPGARIQNASVEDSGIGGFGTHSSGAGPLAGAGAAVLLRA